MNRRQMLGAAALAAVAVPVAAKPPMGQRISCETGDPGERLYSLLCAEGKFLKVFLNGKEIDGVVTADPEAGTIKRIVKSSNGNIAFNRVTGEVFHETLTGEVRWVAV